MKQFALIMSIVSLVNGGDHGAPEHQMLVTTACSPEDLRVCTELLTRALDRHDLGFVTTEMGLNSLCK